MSMDHFERDLRAVLAARAPEKVPGSVHEAFARLDPAAGAGLRGWLERLRPPRLGLDSLRSSGLAFSMLVVLVVLAVAVLHYAGRAPLPPGSSKPPAIDWQTGVVSFEADAVVIEVGGRTFAAPAGVGLASDPSADSWTFEATWRQHGVEMRLNVYFDNDARQWWVREIRTYDGQRRGNWVTYRGDYMRTDRGAAFAGDFELTGMAPTGPTRLRIDGLRLSASAPGALVPTPGECRAIGPVPANPFEPVASELDPDLSHLGIEKGMPASEAQERLDEQGICYEFRLEFPALNRGQTWCTAPPGDVREFLFGSGGQLILFVEDAAPRTNDPNMPVYIGCQ